MQSLTREHWTRQQQHGALGGATGEETQPQKPQPKEPHRDEAARRTQVGF